jgi:hypothetical protein
MQVACTKKPVDDRLFRESGMTSESALQGADMSTEAAFVARGLVFVDKALAGRFVDYRDSFLVSRLGRFRVTGVNGFNNILNMGAQHGALTGVALTTDFRLTRAFTRLCRICQNLSPVPDSKKEPATMRILAVIVKQNTALAGSA